MNFSDYGRLTYQNSRIRRGVLELAAALATFPWIYSYFYGALEGEERTEKATKEPKPHTAEDGQADEDEDEAGFPEMMPEDAIFIPLGFARQQPEIYYKATDPEWQSFIEYRKDREREPAIKSTIFFGYRRLKADSLLEELADLVTNYFTSMKPIQVYLGTPMRFHNYWFDVLIPSGPPPEYERFGYASKKYFLMRKTH